MRLPLILLNLLICSCLSCNYKTHGSNSEKLSSCEQDKYTLIWNINTSDPVWKVQYLEYVGNCLEDTLLAGQLAELDAQAGNYNILLHGIETPLCPFQNIHDQYPISFHVPIRVQSQVAEFYNGRVKYWIRHDLQIDLDSLIQEEFSNCFPEDSI